MNVTAHLADQVLDLLAHHEQTVTAPTDPVTITRTTVAYRLYRLTRPRLAPAWA